MTKLLPIQREILNITNHSIIIMCNIHISTLYLGTFKTPELHSCCEMTQYQCSSLRKSTFPTKTDGEDGAQTGYAAQEHGGTVALLPAPAVQQNQTQGVGREFHHT